MSSIKQRIDNAAKRVGASAEPTLGGKWAQVARKWGLSAEHVQRLKDLGQSPERTDELLSAMAADAERIKPPHR